MMLASIPPPPFEALEIGHFRITLHGLITVGVVFAAAAWTARRWRA